MRSEFDRLLSGECAQILEKFQPRAKCRHGMAVKITFDSHRQRRHFVAKQRVQILLLAIAGDGHAGRKEGDVPHKDEHNGQAAVRAKDLHRRERAVNADHERYDVGERGDGDGNGRLGHHQAHALGHVQFHGCATPSGQHNERVVDADT